MEKFESIIPNRKKKFQLSLAVKVCNDKLGSEEIVPSALVLEEFPSLRSSLGPKVLRAASNERAQAALTERKVMVEAQAKERLKRAIKHQSPKMKSYTHSSGDKELVRRERTVNNRMGEFVGPITVLHHDERSKIVAMDQDGITKRHSSSQIRPFLEQHSVLNGFITERKIEDCHMKTDNNSDKSEYDVTMHN